MGVTKIVCVRCGANAEYREDEKVYRHDALDVFRSTYCDDYGYPIKVREKTILEQVEEKLDKIRSTSFNG